MQKRLAFYLTVAVAFLGFGSSLFAKPLAFSFQREDQVVVNGYVSYPEQEANYPLVIFLDGSNQTSVFENHEKLAAKVNALGMGFVSLEKRGITKNSISKKEFEANDCFEEKYKNYSFLLSQIQQKKLFEESNGVILFGASEGGKVAPKLASNYKERLLGVVLIGSGGGMQFAEEMKFQIEQVMKDKMLISRLGYKLRKALKPHEIDAAFAKIEKKPDSLEIFAHKTWKWFASYFKNDTLDDLLNIDAPIYLLHGKEDKLVPIKSADLVVDAFAKAGKKNLHYVRVLDLGHALTGREDIYTDLFSWMKEQKSKGKLAS